MKTFAATLLALFSSALAAPVEQTSDATTAATISVSYDQKFDVAGSSMTTVSCSDGINGLINKGYPSFGSLPSFPNIGGAPTVGGWNSPNCGKCYQLHYQAGGIDKSIFVTAIDAAPGGFNIGLQAMNTLTNGMAVQLGRVDATYTEVASSNCGL